MFNKKPETKTIAAQCKGGGCKVGRVEGEGDYSLQKVPASRCLRAPWGETQSEQQSLREMQGKGEYLRSEAEQQHDRIIENRNADRNKS